MKERITVVLCVLVMLAVSAGCPGGTARAEDPEFLFGTLAYASVISDGNIGDSFYYSDEWFLGAPEERNDSLALVSAQLSAASDGIEDAALLEKLGFSDVESKRYDSEDPRDIAYVTGRKTVSAGSGTCTVRAVVFQGHDYGEKGWVQNVTVNPEKGVSEEHAAYAAAARIFLEDFDRIPQDDHTVFWICGMSRGGAVANVVSAYLLERENAPAVFCYTFESPATTQRRDMHGERYRSIHNYLSDDDPIPMIPMWGMARFGTDIRINTEAPGELKAVLEQTNPDAVEYMEKGDLNELDGDVRAFLESLIEKLTLLIPEREDYSAIRTVTLPEGDTAEYTFQDGLESLCRILFGESTLNDDIVFELLGCIPDTAWAYLAETWVAENRPGNSGELLREASQKRWNAAGTVVDLLPEETREKVRREDFYALLQLISPLIVDRGMMAEGWALPEREALEDTGFINYSKLIAAGANSPLLILSHHPEAIIARMKLLAPAPSFAEYCLDISAPAAGDSVDAAPAEIRSQAAAFPESWLNIEKAAWLSSGGESLSGHRVHCLEVTLSSIGHLVPDHFRFTVNGMEPVALEIRHENGISLIDGVWFFSLGEPAQAAVCFDMAGHGDAPESYTVESGTILRYAQPQPTDPGTVRDEQGTWDFSGWTDADGNDWKDIAAVKDITLHASWTMVIDRIELSCTIPRKGDIAEEALLSATLPDNLPLELAGWNILEGGTYESVEVIGDAETYDLLVFIKPEEGYRFLSGTTEDGDLVYLGTFTINGHPADSVSLSSDTNQGITEWELICEYSFTPEEP